MPVKRCRTAGKLFVVLAGIFFLQPVLSDRSGAEEMRWGCEVKDFDAFEESRAVLTPAGDYSVTARKQCANVSIRNIYGSAANVDEFVLTAFFGDGKYAEGGFDLAGKDAKKRVLREETYEGVACFDGDSRIVILNCGMK